MIPLKSNNRRRWQFGANGLRRRVFKLEYFENSQPKADEALWETTNKYIQILDLKKFAARKHEGTCISVDGRREVYWGNFCIAEDCLRLFPSQMSPNYKRVGMEISNLGINVWNNTDGYIAINIIFHCDKVKGGLVVGLQSLQKLNFFDLGFFRRRGNKQ